MPTLAQPAVTTQSRDVEELTDRLSDRLDDAIPRATIAERVRQQFRAFERVGVRQFVPVFVERRVRAELSAP